MIDSPGWWRARCRVELDKLLAENERVSPLRLRRALRKAPGRLRKEARQVGAPGYRARIWWKVVRRVLGPGWASAPDRRQQELFK